MSKQIDYFWTFLSDFLRLMCTHLLDINRLLLLRHLVPLNLDSFVEEWGLPFLCTGHWDLGPKLGPPFFGVGQEGSEARFQVLQVRHPRLELSYLLHLSFVPLRRRDVALTRSFCRTHLLIFRRSKDDRGILELEGIDYQ